MQELGIRAKTVKQNRLKPDLPDAFFVNSRKQQVAYPFISIGIWHNSLKIKRRQETCWMSTGKGTIIGMRLTVFALAEACRLQ